MMKFSLKTLIGGTLVVALGLAGVFALVPKPLEVEVATASPMRLRVTVQEDGKTRIREKYIVSAPVAGRLARIELDPGDHCDEQTLLTVILPSDPAMLDSRARVEAEARVQAAQAALARAQSGEKQARIDHDLNLTRLKRAEELMPSKSLSQAEFEVLEAGALASAQAIQTAEFETEIAQFELEMARAAARQFDPRDARDAATPFEIYAPISGQVLRVFEESSTVVAMGDPLLELGDARNLEMEVDVLSTDAVRIHPGAELTIEHWGGEAPLQGNVRVIEPGAFTKISSLGVEEQRVNVIADFNEPPDRLSSLGDGYRIEARITVAVSEDALCIPNSALFRHQREWHVLAIEGGRAVLRQVEIGLQNDSHTQVLSGLQSGQQVIVYPDDTLEPGAAVQPRP